MVGTERLEASRRVRGETRKAPYRELIANEEAWTLQPLLYPCYRMSAALQCRQTPSNSQKRLIHKEFHLW